MAVHNFATGSYFTRATNVPTGNFTAIIWFYREVDSAGFETLFFRGDGSSEYPFFGINLNDQIHIFNGFDFPGSTVVSLNQWHWAAIVRNSSTDWKGYLDSVQEISATSESAGSTSSIVVGNDLAFLAAPFSGRLAAVKVWNTNLTQAEIINEARQYAPIRTANLVAWFPLLKVEGTDYTGSNWTINGTLTAVDGPPIPWHQGRRKKVYIASTGPTPTKGQLVFTEFEAPFAPAKGRLSYIEFEVPIAGTKGQLSYIELEAPLAPAKGKLSITELETLFAPAKGLFSFAELEVPALVTKGRVSLAEFETPLAPAKGRVTYTEMEFPLAPAKGQIAYIELQVPNIGEPTFRDEFWMMRSHRG